MSSRDRRNQSNRNPYGFDLDATDDQFIDERWNDDGFDEPQPQPPRRAAQRPSTPSSTVRSGVDGTAAQIDRLRRAVRQNARRQPASPARTTADAVAEPLPRDRDERYVTDDEFTYDEYGEQYPARDARATRSDRRYQPTYDPYAQDEWEDDGVDQYDETYDDADQYGDDYDVYDDPGERAAPARSRPQVGMPTISRPSLPPAIANAAVLNDAPALALIGTGITSLAAMAILTANRIDSLEPAFASHVSASGVFEKVVPSSAFWNLPLMATMLTLMAFVIAWFVAPVDRFASRFVLGAALLVQFVAWVAVIRIL